jgi:uncharacterized protein YoxC
MKISPCFITVIALVLAVPLLARGAESKCVLDQIIAPLQQKVDSLTRTLKGLEKQYAGMTQTTFQSENDRLAYMERKKELLTKINEKKEELQKLSKDLMFLAQKRALLSKSLNGSRCDFYCEATVDPGAWEPEVDRVQRTFEQIFPSTSVSFAVRPQVFIYADEDKYALCETSDRSIICYSRRQICEMGLVGTPPWPANTRQTVLALVATRGTDSFRHMLAHAYVEELVNPSRSATAVRTSALVEEGFAENIVSTANEKAYEAHATFLLKNLPTPPANDPDFLANLIVREAPPRQDAAQIKSFYAEATVFVRWVSGLKDGFQLLRQLLGVRPAEIETLLRTHQASRNLDRIGFTEYLTWRKGELDRIKAKTLGSAEGPAPAPAAVTNAPPATK